MGLRLALCMLYVTTALWIPWFIYFWVTTFALCLSPFLFNPHQFSFSDFIIDYREFLRWMSRGNSRHHANSWVGYCRLSRTKITGYKRKKLGHPSEKLASDVPRASWRTIIYAELLGPLAMAIIMTMPYLFVKSYVLPASTATNPLVYVADFQHSPLAFVSGRRFTASGSQQVSGLLRIAVISLGPIVFNMIILIVLFLTSLFLGPMLNNCCGKFGATMAAIAHGLSVVGLVGFFELLWFLEVWQASHAVLGVVATCFIQRFFYKFFIAFFLSREFKHDEINRAWWTGVWYNRGLGSHVVSQPAREFVVKLVEVRPAPAPRFSPTGC